jgi:hypothetical protein
MFRYLLGLAILGLALGLAGCAKKGMKTAVVKGTVSYDGKPLPYGSVLFIPESPGPTATGEIGPDGTYTLTTYAKGDGAVLGKHKVVVSAQEDTSNQLPDSRNPLPPPIVPDKYTNPATTDLRAEVEDTVNTKNFELTGELSSKKKKR